MSMGKTVSQYPTAPMKCNDERVSLTYRKEQVANIVSYIDSDSHIGEVEPVAKGDKGESDNMMCRKLFEVLATLLHTQQHNDALLRPERRLKKIVKLECSLLC